MMEDKDESERWENLKPTPELSAEVESAFDHAKYAELEIIVRLPGECLPDGEPLQITHRTILPAAAVRMENAQEVLPAELERLMRLLVISLRFR